MLQTNILAYLIFRARYFEVFYGSFKISSYVLLLKENCYLGNVKKLAQNLYKNIPTFFVLKFKNIKITGILVNFYHGNGLFYRIIKICKYNRKAE